MKKLQIALIAVAATLAVTLVAVAFLFIGRSTGTSGTINAGEQTTPESSQTPSAPLDGEADAPVGEQPVATGGTGTGGNGTGNGGNAPAPAPADNSPRFISFGATLQVFCDSNADEKAQPQISWVAANATAVYWTPSNQDATADNGYQVGASGNQNDMSNSKGPGERYEFPCNHRQTFDTTITLYGANGQKVSKHVTFTDVNWGIDLGDDQD